MPLYSSLISYRTLFNSCVEAAPLLQAQSTAWPHALPQDSFSSALLRMRQCFHDFFPPHQLSLPNYLLYSKAPFTYIPLILFCLASSMIFAPSLSPFPGLALRDSQGHRSVKLLLHRMTIPSPSSFCPLFRRRFYSHCLILNLSRLVSTLCVELNYPISGHPGHPDHQHECAFLLLLLNLL
jgi:hypothetical protein